MFDPSCGSGGAPTDIYSTSSSLFQPNLLLNTNSGVLAKIKLRLQRAADFIKDKVEIAPKLGN